MQIRLCLALSLILAVLAATGCSTSTELVQDRMLLSTPDSDTSSVLDHKFEKYRKLIREFPENPSYRERLSRLYWMRDDYSQALNYIGQARKIDPQNPKYDYIEGRIYRGIGNFHAAELSFKRMVGKEGMDTNYTGPYFELAHLHLMQKNYGVAENYLKKCIAIDPDFADPYYFLGEIAKSRGKKDVAIGFFESYLKTDQHKYSEVALKSLYSLQPSLDPRRFVIR